ncbi:MAG: hypothetical protein ACRDZW_04010 [Acidimicrobiales bacterium]
MTRRPTGAWATGVMVSGARVEAGDRRWELRSGEAFSFGRSRQCTLNLEPPDQGVSRRAGTVEDHAGLWIVTNQGTRSFDVVAPTGIRSPLGPGDHQALGPGQHEILLTGLARRFSVVVVVEGAERATDDEPVLSGVPTEAGLGVRLSTDDQRALVALLAGYLEAFPRADHRPASYGRAAARLGWSSSTLRKRIERIRQRLTDAGVPGLVGDEANERLAEHVLATRVITRAHLDLLGPA